MEAFVSSGTASTECCRQPHRDVSHPTSHRLWARNRHGRVRMAADNKSKSQYHLEILSSRPNTIGHPLGSETARTSRAQFVVTLVCGVDADLRDCVARNLTKSKIISVFPKDRIRDCHDIISALQVETQGEKTGSEPLHIILNMEKTMNISEAIAELRDVAESCKTRISYCIVSVIDADTFWDLWRSEESVFNNEAVDDEAEGQNHGPECNFGHDVHDHDHNNAHNNDHRDDHEDDHDHDDEEDFLSPRDIEYFADILVQHIEFPDLIVVTSPSNDRKAREKVVALVRGLHPHAQIASGLETKPLSIILDHGCWNDLGSDAYLENSGYLHFLNSEFPSEDLREIESHGFVYRIFQARRPFHPMRLHAFIETHLSPSSVIRSNGFFWLASRNEFVGLWDQHGPHLQFESGGQWWMDIDQELWPEDQVEQIQFDMDQSPRFGDRKQELVFFLDTGCFKPSGSSAADNFVNDLSKALLTDEEMKLFDVSTRLSKLSRKKSKSSHTVSSYEDPFPEW